MTGERKTPALISHADIARIRGLVPQLKERHHNAGPALERIVANWDGLGDDFVVIQRTDLIRHLGGSSAPARRRRWWRRAAA